jgi:hypothetical protein
MDVSRPHTAVIGGALEGEVLSVLAGTTRPLTGRQIARLASHGSDRGLRLALNRLAAQGLVDTVEAPPAVLYSLNRDHIAAPIALELAGLRAELFRRLRRAIGEWQVPPMHASMFGSAARGEGDASSDIDLLVVRPASVDRQSRRHLRSRRGGAPRSREPAGADCRRARAGGHHAGGSRGAASTPGEAMSARR